MELKLITGIVLSINQDLLSKTSYLKILTLNDCQRVKISSLKEDYRFSYLLNPCYLLTLELIKTKKNWILKSILSSSLIFKADNFKDHQNLAEFIHYLDKQLKENQQTNSLNKILDSITNPEFKNSSLKDLYFEADTALGFA